MAKSEHSSEQQLHHAGKDNEVLNVVKVIISSLSNIPDNIQSIKIKFGHGSHTFSSSEVKVTENYAHINTVGMIKIKDKRDFVFKIKSNGKTIAHPVNVKLVSIATDDSSEEQKMWLPCKLKKIPHSHQSKDKKAGAQNFDSISANEAQSMILNVSFTGEIDLFKIGTLDQLSHIKSHDSFDNFDTSTIKQSHPSRSDTLKPKLSVDTIESLMSPEEHPAFSSGELKLRRNVHSPRRRKPDLQDSTFYDFHSLVTPKDLNFNLLPRDSVLSNSLQSSFNEEQQRKSTDHVEFVESCENCKSKKQILLEKEKILSDLMVENRNLKHEGDILNEKLINVGNMMFYMDLKRSNT